MKRVMEIHRVAAQGITHIQNMVIDNIKSKSLPKHHCQTETNWSKTRLTIHLGGTFYDNTFIKHYYIYPEIFSESGNTILSQINHELFRNRSQGKKRVVFIFDNHSTQKCTIVVAFFEWLMLGNFLEPYVFGFMLGFWYLFPRFY